MIIFIRNVVWTFVATCTIHKCFKRKCPTQKATLGSRLLEVISVELVQHLVSSWSDSGEMLLFTCCKYVADLLLTTTLNFTYSCFYAWGHCVGKGFTNEHYLKFCYRYTVSKLHPQILGFSSYYDSNTYILLIGHLRDTCQLACRSVSPCLVSDRVEERGAAHSL